MRKFRILVIMIAATALLTSLTGCSSSDKPKQQAAEAPDSGMPRAPQFHGQVAGITWSFPNTWKVAPEKPMRAATYTVDPVEGDVDSAECAVFYFGPTSGGGTQENLSRWAGQFSQADGSESMDKASISEKEISGYKVTTIDLTGIYNVAAGPMMQVTGQKIGYRMLGAIVEGPEGSVFFKMTGPAKTMAAAESAFADMVGSIKPISM